MIPKPNRIAPGVPIKRRPPTAMASGPSCFDTEAVNPVTTQAIRTPRPAEMPIGPVAIKLASANPAVAAQASNRVSERVTAAREIATMNRSEKKATKIAGPIVREK